MTYTRETMQKMRREELKNIAISYRIYMDIMKDQFLK